MDQFLETMKTLIENPFQIICILVTMFVGGEWLIKKIITIKDWYSERLKSYHNEENKKEHKEDETESRFKSIEDKLGTDYIRIQKSESHLYEMTEEMKDISQKFNELNDMLIDLRLETMRGRILDFAPLAIDLTHPQSKERYTEIYKVHGDYIDLIKETGKDNNYETYNFEMIEKSYEQRSIKHLFTEDCYIAPALLHNKENDDNHE